jgi:hypothetical protein
MRAYEAARAATARCGSDSQNVEMLGGSHDSNSANFARDQRLLSLDFLGVVGDSFVTLAAAVCAAAAAENIVMLEMALRQALLIASDGLPVSAQPKPLPTVSARQVKRKGAR